jgi:hypothetical protein
MTTAIARKLPRALITATLALLGTLASFYITATPTHAATAGAYSVSLATPLAAAKREIIDGAMWRCEGDRCTAAANGERAMPVCGKVARKFGPVARFAGPQGELSPEQLARCNGAG